ncbi:MAG: hypothetical protein LBG23_05325 [Endomicrobium sp.]|nr:hypothetical protein [Endomicrobium sp.]
MELLLSTPVKSIEIVIGKIIPYFILNMFSILMIFIISLLVFKILFESSFFIYSIACVIYVTGALALGIIYICCYSSTASSRTVCFCSRIVTFIFVFRLHIFYREHASII